MRAFCSYIYQQLLQKDPSLRLSNVDSIKTHRYFEGLSFEVVLQKEVSWTRRKLQSSPANLRFSCRKWREGRDFTFQLLCLTWDLTIWQNFSISCDITGERHSRAILSCSSLLHFHVLHALCLPRDRVPLSEKVTQRLVKAFLASVAGGYAHACGRNYSSQVVSSNERIMLCCRMSL